MTIDIKRTVIKKKLKSFFATIIVVLLIVLILFTNVYNEESLKMKKTVFAILIAAIYILTIIFNTIRNFYYIYYSDEGDKLVLRYFSLSVFTNRKSSIEIPKSTFNGYKLNKSLFGLTENIVMLQHIQNKVASYPAVSITSLSSREKSRLINSLDKHSNR